MLAVDLLRRIAFDKMDQSRRSTKLPRKLFRYRERCPAKRKRSRRTIRRFTADLIPSEGFIQQIPVQDYDKRGNDNAENCCESGIH